MSVRNALLGLLAQRPRHGYDLRAAFEALVGGEENWDVKPAQVYTTLARLEESGLVAQEAVEQEGGPEKRIFAITPAGCAELEAWFETAVEREHQRDEFFVKLMLALAVDGVDPRRVLRTQRAALYQELHAATAQRQRADPKTELAHMLLLDKAVMYLEADLRWLEIIEMRLDEVQRQPLPEPEVKPRGRPKKV
jgi:DNA-binding PadR family transcriptional regulator